MNCSVQDALELQCWFRACVQVRQANVSWCPWQYTYVYLGADGRGPMQYLCLWQLPSTLHVTLPLQILGQALIANHHVLINLCLQPQHQIQKPTSESLEQGCKHGSSSLTDPAWTY